MDADFDLNLPDDVRAWYDSLSPEDRAMAERFCDAVTDAVLDGIRSTWRSWGGVRSDTGYIRGFGVQPAVYLVHDSTAGIYKVGASANIGRRVRQVIQTQPKRLREINGGVHTVRVICAIPYPPEEMYSREKEWHDFFSAHRIGRSEWFDLPAERVEEFRAASEASGWVAEREGGANAPDTP
jgi:hypothetical protein